jgi:quinol monooxygenase YgiN
MTETSPIQIIAHLVPRPGQEKALADAVAILVPAVLQEPGCLEYAAHESMDHPGTIVMYEVWADKAALDTHAAGPNLGALVARFDELLGEPLKLEALRRFL